MSVDVAEQVKDFTAKSVSGASQISSALVELTDVNFDGSKAFAEKAYDYYTSNLTHFFKTVEKLSTVTDAPAFLEAAKAELSTSFDVVTGQAEDLMKLGGKTCEAGYESAQKFGEVAVKAFPIEVPSFDAVMEMMPKVPAAAKPKAKTKSKAKAKSKAKPASAAPACVVPAAPVKEAYTKSALTKMLEADLVVLAKSMGIEASVDDLKADTVAKVLAAQ